MGNSRMVAIRNQDVFMVHTCSKCGFPMITVVQISAEAQKEYIFSQAKASKIANETAENAIYEEISRIESCYNTKSILVGTRKDRGMISPGYFCTASFKGFATRCPQCLNIEPWKSSESQIKINELSKENFPIVFTDPQKAETWAIDIVKEIEDGINKSREIPSVVEDAVEKVIDLKLKIHRWTKEIESIPEIIDRDGLMIELSNAEKLKTRLGIFDLKSRKVLNKKLEALNSQTKYLNSVIEKKKTPIMEKVISADNELLITQSIAFGCSAEVASRKTGNAISYFPAPNNISDEINVKIEKLERSDESICGRRLAPQTDNVQEKETNLENNRPHFCRKCGYKLLDNSNFCSKCGAKVE